MIVVITGGRDYNDGAAIYAALDSLHTVHPITCLYQGGASGADRWSKAWAIERGVPFREFLADWDNLGKKAGFMRNYEMLAFNPRPTYCVSFPGGAGTAHMTKICEEGYVTVWKPY